jgi:hypothetical protein
MGGVVIAKTVLWLNLSYGLDGLFADRGETTGWPWGPHSLTFDESQLASFPEAKVLRS